MSRHAIAIGAALAAAALGAGCAKDATGIEVTVNAAANVPPILILRTAIARADDPGHRVSSDRTSPYASDAGDRPGPFDFPMLLSLTVDESFAGPVVVTVQGIDWDTHAVTASGVGDAVVAVQKTSSAALTLVGPSP